MLSWLLASRFSLTIPTQSLVEHRAKSLSQSGKDRSFAVWLVLPERSLTCYSNFYTMSQYLNKEIIFLFGPLCRQYHHQFWCVLIIALAFHAVSSLLSTNHFYFPGMTSPAMAPSKAGQGGRISSSEQRHDVQPHLSYALFPRT